MNSLSRIWAILMKELIQMRRDKMTFAMMIGLPIVQLVIFGFAINTDPKHLPTAVYAEENTIITRTILKGFENSNYYQLTYVAQNIDEANELLVRGKVSFVIHIPAGFTEKLIRQQKPQLLVEADASDPAAASNAIARVNDIVNRALAPEFVGRLAYLKAKPSNVDIVVQAKYNPEGITQYNIVPGLLGVILTMTSVMITSMAMTRESERGNLENILAMPSKSYEVMVGKISPYVLVGAVQTVIILLAAHYVFNVPFTGSISLLSFGVFIFLIANLALGFTFSTVAKTQMQAMQMTFFFFLPSILLSGFMFPFRGMPHWAQFIGEILPLTHFLRIVRGVMLKSAEYEQLKHEFFALGIFITIAGFLAIIRYKKTLD